MNVDELLNMLSNLPEEYGEIQSLLDDIENVLESEDLTELERQGFILLKTYLKEIRSEKDRCLVVAVRNMSRVLEGIRFLRRMGAKVVSLEELVRVGEIEGKEIYTVTSTP